MLTESATWTDEWGTQWGHAEGGIGATTTGYPLADWSQLDDYLAHRFPDPRARAGSIPRRRPSGSTASVATAWA